VNRQEELELATPERQMAVGGASQTRRAAALKLTKSARQKNRKARE
jgi:hypothetical protein